MASEETYLTQEGEAELRRELKELLGNSAAGFGAKTKRGCRPG